MRGALLVALMLVWATPICSATAPIVPAIVVTISPTNKEVASPPDAKVSVNFNGTVTADKLPFVRIVVSLSPSVDMGWPASCDPSTITITDSQPHDFRCNVSVPENSQNGTGTLTIDATGRGGGFTVTTSVTAVIIVHSTASTNRTGGTGGTGKTGTNQTNGGGTQTTQGGTSKIGPFDMPTMLILVVVIAVAAVSVVYWIRQRRITRRRFAESGEAPVEDVEAL